LPRLATRIARWHILIPKIPIWVVFGRPSRGKCIVYAHLEYFTVIGCIVWPFGIFCGDLVYFTVIWYIVWPFGIFFGHLIYFVVIWYIL
jgi:hypothetical protein